MPDIDEKFEVALPSDLQIDSPEPEGDTQSILHAMIDEAVQYYEGNIEPEQALATDYYMARKFGNEDEGRSQVVSTDVRDSVQNVMPSLMRIFTGPDKVVEFKPRGPEDEQVAAQATDYINYIVQEDNNGFLV